MKKTIYMKALPLFILLSMFVQLSGCGTILHPERRGQTSGRIDPAIAILDGVGLLLFLIPGVIAFAVDFTTGAIYLPGGGSYALSDDDGIKVVHVNPAELNENRIKQVVVRETGVSGIRDLNQSNVWTLSETEDVGVKLAEMKMSGYLTP